MSYTTTNVRFQLRRDTASNWAAAGNPILLLGEAGYDTTNKILKIGDGASTWTNLPAISGGGGGGGGTSLDPGTTQGDFLTWNGANWVTGGEGDVKIGGGSTIVSTVPVPGVTNYSVVIGSVASGTDTDVVIGSGAVATYSANVSIGQGASATGSTVAIGPGTTSNGYGVVIGRNAVSATNSVAVGYSAQSGTSGVSIGDTAIGAANGVSIGNASSGTASNAISIGNSALCSGIGSISIGGSSIAGFDDSVAIGKSTITSSINTVVIGKSGFIGIGANNSVAVGYNAICSTGATNSVIVGDTLRTDAPDTVVIGTNSSIRGVESSGSIVIGNSTNIKGASNTIVINALEDAPPDFTTSNACFIRPIRGAPNPNDGPSTPVALGTLWYDVTTGEVCYHTV